MFNDQTNIPTMGQIELILEIICVGIMQEDAQPKSTGAKGMFLTTLALDKTSDECFVELRSF